jgi:hypothetical protein
MHRHVLHCGGNAWLSYPLDLALRSAAASRRPAHVLTSWLSDETRVDPRCTRDLLQVGSLPHVRDATCSEYGNAWRRSWRNG